MAALLQGSHRIHAAGVLDEALPALSTEPRALMDAALARLGFIDSEDAIDNPLVILCEAAKLTPFEYEAVAMMADGISARRIGRMQWPRRTEEAVRAAARRGVVKLRGQIGA